MVAKHCKAEVKERIIIIIIIIKEMFIEAIHRCFWDVNSPTYKGRNAKHNG